MSLLMGIALAVPALAFWWWRAEMQKLQRRLARAQAELRCALDRRQAGSGPERLPPEAVRLQLERLPANTLLLTGEGGTIREVHPPFSRSAATNSTGPGAGRPAPPAATSVPGPGRKVLG